MESRAIDPESAADAIVAVLRRSFEEQRRRMYRKQSAALAAALELGPQMELRDFVALLAAVGMSFQDLCRELQTSASSAGMDEPASALGGVGMERWLEEIRQIRKRVTAGNVAMAGKAERPG